MEDLDLISRREFIEELVAQHVTAIVEQTSLLQFPERITADEIEDCLLALAIRGQTTGNQCLSDHADEIQTPDEFLRHLVLHEVAHIKHDWRQDKETDCDLWVYAQRHGEA